MKMTRLEKLIRRLEKAGFVVDAQEYGDGTKCYEIELRHTPAGEDWIEQFHTVDDFIDRANSFDVDEEVAVWVDAKYRGMAGIPGLSELLKDQKWKKRTLMRIAKGL